MTHTEDAPEPVPVLLFVEDDPADVQLISRAISKVDLPIRVVHLGDGDQAVNYLSGEGEFADREAHPVPWLVLLDIKMPRRSGLEVVQWMREQSDPVGSIPVVMFTSSSHAVDVNTAYQFGANSYLVKPENYSQMLSTMNVLKTYWLQLNKLPRPSGAAHKPA